MTAPQYNAVFRYHLLYRNVQIALVKILLETICGCIFLAMYTKYPSVPPIANDATDAVGPQDQDLEIVKFHFVIVK